MTMTNPRPENNSPELEAFAGIDAAPLITQSILNIVKPRSAEIIFYWGNRIAGEGLRYNQLLSAGFEPAKPEDCKVPPPQTVLRDGKIMYGDLIAMKISKRRYYAALKHNHNNAIMLANRARAQNSGKAAAQAEVNKTAPNEIAQKIKFFVPSDQEVNAAVEGKEFKGGPNG